MQTGALVATGSSHSQGKRQASTAVQSGKRGGPRQLSLSEGDHISRISGPRMLYN